MTDALVYTAPPTALAPHITAPVQPHVTDAVVMALFIELFLIVPLQTHVTFNRIELKQRNWPQTKAFLL